MNGHATGGSGNPLAQLLEKLDQVRSQGEGWRARCPAHEDRATNLSVERGQRRPAVLKCFNGCPEKTVVEALGLDWANVYAPRGKSPEAGERAAGKLSTTCMSDVIPERIDWLWPGYLPLGKVVLLDGDPGLGKSTMALDFAARVSTGQQWPDLAANGKPGNVLLLSAEDDKAATVRPRLEAHGADLARIHYVEGIKEELPDGSVIERQPMIPADISHLQAATTERKPRLIIIDVLMAYLDSSVDSYRDQHVRQALLPLSKFAEQCHCCILVLRHLTKTVGGKAVYRGGGSIGIGGAARATFIVGEDSNNVRVFACAKMNIARMPASLEYEMVSDEKRDCGKIRWLGRSALQADELLNPENDERQTAKEEADRWLFTYLKDADGAADSKDVKTAGREKGYNERTLQRAAESNSHVEIVNAATFPRRTLWRLNMGLIRQSSSEPDTDGGRDDSGLSPVAPTPEYGATGAGKVPFPQVVSNDASRATSSRANLPGATVNLTVRNENGSPVSGPPEGRLGTLASVQQRYQPRRQSRAQRHKSGGG